MLPVQHCIHPSRPHPLCLFPSASHPFQYNHFGSSAFGTLPIWGSDFVFCVLSDLYGTVPLSMLSIESYLSGDKSRGWLCHLYHCALPLFGSCSESGHWNTKLHHGRFILHPPNRTSGLFHRFSIHSSPIADHPIHISMGLHSSPHRHRQRTSVLQSHKLLPLPWLRRRHHCPIRVCNSHSLHRSLRDLYRMCISHSQSANSHPIPPTHVGTNKETSTDFDPRSDRSVDASSHLLYSLFLGLCVRAVDWKRSSDTG